MYEKLEECPSCKHPKFLNHMICKDYSVSGESFALVKCEKCSLIFTNPRPDTAHIDQYYQSENYISHTNKANNITNLLYKVVRGYTLKQKVQLIERYTNHKKLLDFGCGTGTFLKYCTDQGFESEGYEPNPVALKHLTKTTSTKVMSRINELKKDNHYDIITAWHVLEHVHDLKATLKILRKALQPEGYLFVALPNPESYDATFYKQHWAGYDVPRHLYHFSQTAFSHLVKQCKLEIAEIHPMKFDSFYVSLLSERYKTGSSQFIKAFLSGLKSNKAASKSGQYSSLIYVLTK